MDIITVIGLVVLTPVAWLLPQHWWPKLGRCVIALVLHLLPRTAATTAARIDYCLGLASDRLSTHEIIKRALSRYYEETLLLLKCYRPDGWEPVVELHGLEHLQAAVSNGKGVVLWISHFQHYSLISKIAMFRAGFAFSHLSHPRHGFSSTLFGMRFLNPIRTHVEDRYLKERVYMGLDESKTAVNTLRERLLAAGVISITARGDKVHKPVSVPFLNGSLPLAIGAPGLAQQTQATLLPVHTVQMDSSAYTAIIEPPIALNAAQSKWVAGEAAAREYASRLEPVVREFPDQWEGWGYVVTGLPSK
jgi:lauroyl/myristoyl acyltransferase